MTIATFRSSARGLSSRSNSTVSVGYLDKKKVKKMKEGGKSCVTSSVGPVKEIPTAFWGRNSNPDCTTKKVLSTPTTDKVMKLMLWNRGARESMSLFTGRYSYSLPRILASEFARYTPD